MHVNVAPILSWYGIKSDIKVTHFTTSKDSITLVNKQIFIQEQASDLNLNSLNGAVFTGDFYVLLSEQSLILLTPAGEKIETLSQVHGLPKGIRALGFHHNTVRLQLANKEVLSNDGLLSWHDIESTTTWSTSNPISYALNSKILSHYQGDGLPLERVILDLHSGRFLGKWAVYLTDLAALGIIYLVLTGLMMWLKRKKKRQNN